MLSLAVAGAVLSATVQYVKTNPNIPWLNPENNKLIHAAVAVGAVVAGIVAASQQPGGLLAHDWAHTLQVVGTDGAIVAAAALAFYNWVLKAYENAKKKAQISKVLEQAEPLKPLDPGELLSGPVLDAVVKAVKTQLESTTKP